MRLYFELTRLTKTGNVIPAINNVIEPCKMLYIGSPAYLSEIGAIKSFKITPAWKAIGSRWLTNRIGNCEPLSSTAHRRETARRLAGR
jgi:hypothetical protein